MSEVVESFSVNINRPITVQLLRQAPGRPAELLTRQLTPREAVA